MTDEPKQPNWQDQALEEARKIGTMLKAKHDIQPGAVPQLDREGFMRVAYSPPPSPFDISLNELGKQTQVY